MKPPVVKQACTNLKNWLVNHNNLPGKTLQPVVISVAAGVRVTSIESWLPDDTAVIRCMPNTPSLLGLGSTAMYANSQVSEEQKLNAQRLLDKAGISTWVENESMLDAVTALSGSGPAYFFYLIEHMAECGEKLGLEKHLATEFAIETAFGAASMARLRQDSPAVLRDNVTSKGGTTAAALQVFNDQKLPTIVLNAMQAARDRAVELGDELAS